MSSEHCHRERIDRECEYQVCNAAGFIGFILTLVDTELSGFYLGAIMKRELIACFERRCDTCGEVRKCATVRFPTLHMSGKGLRKRKFKEDITKSTQDDEKGGVGGQSAHQVIA